MFPVQESRSKCYRTAMTPGEYADFLRKKVAELQQVNKPLLFGANACTQAVYERAFNNGQNQQGQTFQYKSDWYKRKREKRGFETGFVDWTFEGDLKSDFANAPKGSGKAEVIKVDRNEYVTGFVRDINKKKYEGLSRYFGDFLEPNQKEEALFYSTVEFEFEKMFTP